MRKSICQINMTYWVSIDRGNRDKTKGKTSRLVRRRRKEKGFSVSKVCGGTGTHLTKDLTTREHTQKSREVVCSVGKVS